MSTLGMPIPLTEIESVLAWVDGFKLSRPTKKISRDFSDAVLLAEILAVHYPKLVEMHNYPPRNSHSLKLNNWMTLNRKVLKKLKLNLCCNTMEQLANCAPGIVERVLVMVREKIRRDEEANRGKDEQNVSSGGSYYEACGDDEHVLVVPVKARVNGVLETIQQKVVNYEAYLALKEELKDAKDTADVLKQKVEHLDSLLKLKEERIDELQKQLERKQVRRREAEAFINSLSVPFETVPSPAPITIDPVNSHKNEQSVNPIKNDINVLAKPSKDVTNDSPFIEKEHTIKVESIPSVNNDNETNHVAKIAISKSRESIKSPKVEESKIPIKHDSSIKPINKASYTKDLDNLDRIKSDVFRDIENVDDIMPIARDDEYEDSEQNLVITIEETIQNEINSINNPIICAQDRDSQKNVKVLNNNDFTGSE